MPIVQTVLGAIDPNLLGRTLTHEHLALDFEGFYCEPPEDFKSYLKQKISLETLGYVRQYPYSSHENVHFYDEDAREATKKDVFLYKKFGGGSIVDNSSHGLKRNLEHLVDVAKSTGVHIIAGTGHYVHNLQEKDHLNMSVEQMTDLYSREIITGVEVEGLGMVKCGYIGEVGSVYPLHDFEKHAIRATGEIQEVLGCGVSFHPGRDAAAPFEIMRLYLEAGGRADKAIMSHVDRTLLDIDQVLEFAKLGSYIQYDLFGTESSFYQLNPAVDMPSDGQRISYVLRLLEEGLVNRILLSHDIHTKHRLTTYGGHGYHHVYMNILPRLFAKGVSIEDVEQITVTNPANWLQFNI
ncbi:phosphotriesterase-related protein [Anastrepha obliqua]|uniref:phosphotriesterase-related protein n=1 Tax=Anastrepha obliqua TaxID=95512 RepID=UPI00240A14B5|nr:phosphotriesterase-related protein [Anastrepha obliqua]